VICHITLYDQDQTPLNNRTIGRETSCDLVLEHSTASRLHARIELASDRKVYVLDAGSRNGTFLNRNDDWIRVKKVSLCVGDRIRFGEYEVPLAQLTAVFGKHADVRLGTKHFVLRKGTKGNGTITDRDEVGPVLQKPRRNPLTGKIEEERL